MYQFLWNHTRSLLASSRKKFLAVACIISFLLFFINILVLLRYNTEILADQLQSQLGMYLYVKDSLTATDSQQKITNFQNVMQEHKLGLRYLSKEDALSQFSKRLPDIGKSFEKYGIKNPLPSTLYVTFENQEQYEILQTTISEYEDVFEVGESLQSNNSFAEQQYRVSQVINFIQTMRLVMIFLIIVLALIMISFLYFTMRVLYFQFQKQLEIEKLLGMSYAAILSPFLILTVAIVSSSFLLMCLYSVLAGVLLNHYFLQIFFQTIFEILLPRGGVIILYLLGLLLFFMFGGIGTIWFSLSRLIRKI